MFVQHRASPWAHKFPRSPPVTPPPNFPDDFTQVLGGESGYRLALAKSGQWWSIDPQGGASVICGVQGMDCSIGVIPAEIQVAGWGFNLLLPPVDASFCGEDLPYLHDLQLSRCGPAGISEEGVALPDVFNPQWVEAVEQIANGVVATPWLAGWLGDSELKWGATPDEAAPSRRPSLLQVCLGLDPAYCAYHSTWEFVLARHGGELQRVASAWSVSLTSRGAVRQLTREEVVFTGEIYRQDLDAFTVEFAERYFTSIRDAPRQVNSGCLLFSPTLHARTPVAVVAAARRNCDASLVTQSGLEPTTGPEILIQQHWRDVAVDPDSSIGESELEALICEGRRSLVAAISRSSTLGYAWSPFRRGDLSIDLPTSVGLVDDNGRENGVYCLPLSSLNSAAIGIRSNAVGVVAPN